MDEGADVVEGFAGGDHLHPNDTGYYAMADAVNLNALLGAPHNIGRPCLVDPSAVQIKPGAGVYATCHPQPAGYTYDDTSSALVYSSQWTHANSSAGYISG
ncbi:MAG TPA: hypothetical protein VGJ07_23955, partial [Rugosimonospora sp.]